MMVKYQNEINDKVEKFKLALDIGLFEKKDDGKATLEIDKMKKQRYLGSPLRYGGGKTLAVKSILPLIPNNIDKVVSPFIGGGSVEIAIAKELNKKVIAYDIFDLLVNYWQVQIEKLIKTANEILNDFREQTADIFMTPFKGVRQDGKFRRRLDYAMARNILNEGLSIMC